MLLNTNSWRNTPQTLSIGRTYCGWHGILSVLPVHKKSPLVSYINLTLDHIGPACIGENEADVMEPGNKPSRQRLSTGGCTRQAVQERRACTEQPGVLCTLPWPRLRASSPGGGRRGKDSLHSEPSTCFPFHAKYLACQCFPELFSVPALTQMLSATVHDCSLLALTSGTITAC